MWKKFVGTLIECLILKTKLQTIVTAFDVRKNCGCKDSRKKKENPLKYPEKQQIVVVVSHAFMRRSRLEQQKMKVDEFLSSTEIS